MLLARPRQPFAATMPLNPGVTPEGLQPRDPGFRFVVTDIQFDVRQVSIQWGRRGGPDGPRCGGMKVTKRFGATGNRLQPFGRQRISTPPHQPRRQFTVSAIPNWISLGCTASALTIPFSVVSPAKV